MAIPVITSSLTLACVVNVSTKYRITATNFPTSFSASGLPPQMSQDFTTGKLGGKVRVAGVYSATLMRWFTDTSEDEDATHEFLAARIDNVMQFEKMKARLNEQAKKLPSLADIVAGFSARKS